MLLVVVVAVEVSHKFESIDARSRRVVSDYAYTRSRLKVLCPSEFINK